MSDPIPAFSPTRDHYRPELQNIKAPGIWTDLFWAFVEYDNAVPWPEGEGLVAEELIWESVGINADLDFRLY